MKEQGNSYWLFQSDEAILLEIGRAQASLNRNAFPPSAARLVELAADWLRTNVPKIQQRICADKTLQAHVKNHEHELVFEAVCELVVHIVAEVPAGCVAAYCVRRGVDKYCADFWKANPSE